MSFQPVVPFGGFAGWQFLKRTQEAQQSAHDNAAIIQNNIKYFRNNIAEINSAEALVSDRRLLSVALGAFGLDDDINNRYFIRKVLEDGTLKDDALANKLSDKRYLELSQAFGFGDFPTPRTVLSDFPDEIISAYKTRQFEVSVGEQNSEMRLALNVERELPKLADKDMSVDAKWFTVMGSQPLREVLQTALGLPQSFASIDLDQQLEVFKDRAESVFGSKDIAQFNNPEKMDELIRLYLARAQLAQQSFDLSPARAALTLLQSGIR